MTTIYITSVVCYLEKYQLNVEDRLVHNSKRNESPAAFWHYLGRLTIPSVPFGIKTAGIFLHTLSVVAER